MHCMATHRWWWLLGTRLAWHVRLWAGSFCFARRKQPAAWSSILWSYQILGSSAIDGWSEPTRQLPAEFRRDEQSISSFQRRARSGCWCRLEKEVKFYEISATLFSNTYSRDSWACRLWKWLGLRSFLPNPYAAIFPNGWLQIPICWSGRNADHCVRAGTSSKFCRRFPQKRPDRTRQKLRQSPEIRRIQPCKAV